MRTGQDLLVQGLGVLVFALLQVAGSLWAETDGVSQPGALASATPPTSPDRPGYQVVLGLGYVGVIGPEAHSVDLQRPPVVMFHLLSFALVLAQQCQVAQLLGHVGVKLAQDLGREQESEMKSGQEAWTPPAHTRAHAKYALHAHKPTWQAYIHDMHRHSV